MRSTVLPEKELKVGLRRAYNSFSKIHGGVLWSKLIRLLRESDPKRPLDFLTTNQIKYGESDFEDLMAGRRGEPTQNARKNLIGQLVR